MFAGLIARIEYIFAVISTLQKHVTFPRHVSGGVIVTSRSENNVALKYKQIIIRIDYIYRRLSFYTHKQTTVYGYEAACVNRCAERIDVMVHLW